MSPRRRLALWMTCALSIVAWPRAGAAVSRAAVGEVVQGAEMRTLEGRPAQLLSKKARVNVLVFFRPGHAYSLETLQGIASCTQELASKPVHFAAVVSSTWPRERVKQTVREAGIGMPVLIDRGDELYGRLGVQVHPAVVVLDEEQRLVAHEPFLRVNFCNRVVGKIRYALHEIDLDEMRRTEDPGPGPEPTAGRPESEAFVSARAFVIDSNEFEEAAPPAQALDRDREAGAARASRAARGTTEAAGEASPR